MRDWSLAPGDPLCHTLQRTPASPFPITLNDHIWNSPLWAVESLLRSRCTPRTGCGQNPCAFSCVSAKTEKRSVIRRLLPYRLRFGASIQIFSSSTTLTLKNIDVTTEYWVPQSNAVSSRVSIASRTSATRKIRMEVCALLTPIDGQGMLATQMQMVTSWPGKQVDSSYVLFLTGGPVRFGSASLALSGSRAGSPAYTPAHLGAGRHGDFAIFL